MLTLGGDQTVGTIQKIIAEHTGYTEDMLEPDLDLEADLGIDLQESVEFYIYGSPDEMRDAMADCPSAVDNALRIAEACEVEIELGALLAAQKDIDTAVSVLKSAVSAAEGSKDLAPIAQLPAALASMTAGLESTKSGLDGVIALLDGQMLFLDGLATDDAKAAEGPKGEVSAITRDYALTLETAGGAPLLSVFGGKIATHRKLAEHAMAHLQPVLGLDAGAWTATATLPGGDLPNGDFEAFVAAIEAERLTLLDATLDPRSTLAGLTVGELVAIAGVHSLRSEMQVRPAHQDREGLDQ